MTTSILSSVSDLFAGMASFDPAADGGAPFGHTGIDHGTLKPDNSSWFGRDAAMEQAQWGHHVTEQYWSSVDDIMNDGSQPHALRDLVALTTPVAAVGLGVLNWTNAIATVVRDPSLLVEPFMDIPGTVMGLGHAFGNFLGESPQRQLQDMVSAVGPMPMVAKGAMGALGASAAPELAGASNARPRWAPDPLDVRFEHTSPPVLNVAERGFEPFVNAVAEYFADKGGILAASGPSGVGKGTLAQHLQHAMPDKDIAVLEQDWFMASADVRKDLIQRNLDRLEGPQARPPNEWRGFWDHGAVHDTLSTIRAAFDEGVATTVTIPNAWHRTPNEQGLHAFDEVLQIDPKHTLVYFDAKYDLNRLSGGRPMSDMTVRLTDSPDNVRAKYIMRTEERYPDPLVQAEKLHAFDAVIAPSFDRYLDIQQRSTWGMPEDLLLNVDLNFVPK